MKHSDPSDRRTVRAERGKHPAEGNDAGMPTSNTTQNGAVITAASDHTTYASHNRVSIGPHLSAVVWTNVRPGPDARRYGALNTRRTGRKHVALPQAWSQSPTGYVCGDRVRSRISRSQRAESNGRGRWLRRQVGGRRHMRDAAPGARRDQGRRSGCMQVGPLSS